LRFFCSFGKGGKRYNSQPILALSRFVGIADGLLTPVDKKWHTLKPRNPELLEDKAVKDWFYNVNQLLSLGTTSCVSFVLSDSVFSFLF
jgi:hypothetical protein